MNLEHLFVSRELHDGRYIREKIGSKEAKDLFEHSSKLEKEIKHHITGNRIAITKMIINIIDSLKFLIIMPFTV